MCACSAARKNMSYIICINTLLGFVSIIFNIVKRQKKTFCITDINDYLTSVNICKNLINRSIVYVVARRVAFTKGGCACSACVQRCNYVGNHFKLSLLVLKRSNAPANVHTTSFCSGRFSD